MATSSLKYYTDNYVCRVCHGNLTLQRDSETGAWGIVCARDPTHFGAWKKSYLERRLRQERVEYVEITHDRALRELHPWLPEPEPMTAAQAMADLYGERDTALMCQRPRGRNVLFKT